MISRPLRWCLLCFDKLIGEHTLDTLGQGEAGECQPPLQQNSRSNRCGRDTVCGSDTLNLSIAELGWAVL
jgi:hypothetical protein